MGVSLGVEVRKEVTVSEQDLQPLEDSRGEAHFVMKWPFSRETAYIKLLPAHKGIRSAVTGENSGSFVPILAMECRNCEPTSWHPSVDFIVRSNGNTIFDKVDLSSRDWADYDEENDVPVSITNLEFKIELVR